MVNAQQKPGQALNAAPESSSNYTGVMMAPPGPRPPPKYARRNV